MRVFLSLLLGTGFRDRFAGLLDRSVLPFLHLSGGRQHSHRAAPQRPNPTPSVEVPSLDHPQQRSQGAPHALRWRCHLYSARPQRSAPSRASDVTRQSSWVCGGRSGSLSETRFSWWESWPRVELCTSYSKWGTASRRCISFEMSWGCRCRPGPSGAGARPRQRGRAAPGEGGRHGRAAT